MAQRKKSRGHRHPGTAAGLSGVSVTHAQTRVLHSVDAHPPSTTHDGSIWGRRRVLLLNSTYEPLTALPMRRAVIMLMCGKATVVHDDPNGPVIHSASRSITVPSVIRLHSYVRVPYRARIPMTRAALMHRDRFRCAYCGAKADTVDHVVPRSRGG
ncbi:MAG TPA: HNH endonuclease, partial [Mycobacterium sp.]|nr:HNH endonuclease [Mycobacterium sp.]